MIKTIKIEKKVIKESFKILYATNKDIKIIDYALHYLKDAVIDVPSDGPYSEEEIQDILQKVKNGFFDGL